MRTPRENQPVDSTCSKTQNLAPGYLDGELSEEQAGPLRKHLLECPACRELVKNETMLKRWFVEQPSPAVPAGFAARLARRALAGDPGLLSPERRARGPELEQARVRGITTFVQGIAAAAAIVLIGFSAAIRSEELPATNELEAEEGLGELFRQLDRENRLESLERRHPRESSSPAQVDSAPDGPTGDGR